MSIITKSKDKHVRSLIKEVNSGINADRKYNQLINMIMICIGLSVSVITFFIVMLIYIGGEKCL